MITEASQAQYHIKTKLDQKCYIGGVPLRYWKENKFVPFMNFQDGGIVTAGKQNKAFELLLKSDAWKRPSLFVIGSTPTDHSSMIMSMLIAKTVLNAGGDVTIQDMGAPDVVENNPSLVYFGVNIFEDSIPERRQRIRDWCRRFKGNMKVLAVGGDPVVFLRDVLRVRAENVFMIDEGHKNENKSLTMC